MCENCDPVLQLAEALAESLGCRLVPKVTAPEPAVPAPDEWADVRRGLEALSTPDLIAETRRLVAEWRSDKSHSKWSNVFTLMSKYVNKEHADYYDLGLSSIRYPSLLAELREKENRRKHHWELAQAILRERIACEFEAKLAEMIQAEASQQSAD